MSALFASELLKLRTTRTGLTLIAAVVGIVVLISLLASLAGSAPTDTGQVRDALGIAVIAQPFALVLGILAVTTEFRHGTITPTLIAAPDRVRLVLAKLAAHLVAGLVLGALAAGLCALIILSVASARGAPALESSEVVKVVAGHIIATALWAGLGVGFGALLRNQVGAIVTALAWTFAGEQLLGIVPAGIGDAVTKYGTSGASNALTLGNGGNGGNDATSPDTLGQLPGGLLLAGYALVFLVLGTLMLRRRDITQ